jgi:hypothetical protein
VVDHTAHSSNSEGSGTTNGTEREKIGKKHCVRQIRHKLQT